MAPKKRSADEENDPPTRRSSRLATLNINNNNKPADNPEQPKKKKPKKIPKQQQEAQKEPKAEVEKVAVDGDAKTIIIEHCKQCNAFKTRAVQVKDALEKGVEGVNVVVNPEKPRRGCFEIREENGEIFISLLDMKRPFPPLKALDMDQVIDDIIEKIK